MNRVVRFIFSSQSYYSIFTVFEQIESAAKRLEVLTNFLPASRRPSMTIRVASRIALACRMPIVRKLIDLFRSFFFFCKPTSNNYNIAIIFSWDYRTLLRVSLMSRDFGIYAFDWWPCTDAMMVPLVQALNPDIIFFTSMSTLTRLKRQLHESIRLQWIPEGIDLERYTHNSSTERNIDILVYGRPAKSIDRETVEALQSLGLNCVVARPGEKIFSTNSELIDALKRSKISICYPRSITDPDEAGDTETVTLRYFEALACGCLLVGHAPAELSMLLGFNPCVECEPIRLREVLPLAVKRFKELSDVHSAKPSLMPLLSWENRIANILSYVQYK